MTPTKIISSHQMQKVSTQKGSILCGLVVPNDSASLKATKFPRTKDATNYQRTQGSVSRDTNEVSSKKKHLAWHRGQTRFNVD
jgi:hypothetical protein